MAAACDKPLVIITGAAGNIGEALTKALRRTCRVVGLDQKNAPHCDASYTFDLTSRDSIRLALGKVREKHGPRIAAVIHLAAYFDFSGEDSPLYDAVNVKGTANLLEELQALEVERFIYSSTMLVHEPAAPGIRTTEDTPLGPKWAYPRSKFEAEEEIRKRHGDIPYTILRLAGLYDEMTAVPTLSHQIARIYERDLKSRLYAGDPAAGQAFLHRDDMVDAFCRVVDRRADLPAGNEILIGEDVSASYEELQNSIGMLVHGRQEWQTIQLPELLAKAGAWAEEKSEPVVPDDFDKGEKPFIRAFMVDLASDHYHLDVSRAAEQLGWTPQHRIHDALPDLIESLKEDPVEWYRANGITPPDWVSVSEEKHVNAERLRQRYEERYASEHRDHRWAHFLNAALGMWLLAAPFALAYDSLAMTLSDRFTGMVLIACGLAALSPRLRIARWGAGLAGAWLLAAPLVFWTPVGAAYFNDTLVGGLVIGFALLTRPVPGVSPAAEMTGPAIPPGWDVNPSSWLQRLPIIILAIVGFSISAYLTGYQLGYVTGVWDPFFDGGPDPGNGTEEIITSFVSEAWPVPDAGLGALTYMLEILAGIMGSTRRWRTMPWLVLAFGIMIVPLGATSIFFIIIQPIWLDTWCTLCLVAAAAMLIQIPYSLDELVATGAFLWRRHGKGRPLLRIFFTGDSDEGRTPRDEDEFDRPFGTVLGDMLGGGVTVPWNMGLATLVGIWLMCTRLTLGVEGLAADADHLIGALAITVAVTAMAETGRIVRYLLVPLGLALMVMPFVTEVHLASLVSSIICGAALVAVSFRRGPVHNSYGDWDRFIR